VALKTSGNGKAWLGLIATTLVILGTLASWVIAVGRTYSEAQTARAIQDRAFTDAIKRLDETLQAHLARDTERDQRLTVALAQINELWDYLALLPPSARPALPSWQTNTNKEFRRRLEELERYRLSRPDKGDEP
jgi:hypothetical protein